MKLLYALRTHRHPPMSGDLSAVVNFLTSLGLEKHCKKFEEEEVDMGAVDVMEESDYKQLGVAKVRPYTFVVCSGSSGVSMLVCTVFFGGHICIINPTEHHELSRCEKEGLPMRSKRKFMVKWSQVGLRNPYPSHPPRFIPRVVFTLSHLRTYIGQEPIGMRDGACLVPVRWS